MSGGGAMSSMSDSIRRNKSLLERNKNRRRDSIEQLKNPSHSKQQRLVQKKYSARKILQIKKRIKKETQEEQTKFIRLLVGVGILSLAAIILLIWILGVF